MNLKIGELVEYVDGVRTSHERRMRKLKGVLEGLAQENTCLREEIDGLEQTCANLEKQLAVAEERVESCKKTFKEMEDGLSAEIEKVKNNVRNALRNACWSECFIERAFEGKF